MAGEIGLWGTGNSEPCRCCHRVIPQGVAGVVVWIDDPGSRGARMYPTLFCFRCVDLMAQVVASARRAQP